MDKSEWLKDVLESDLNKPTKLFLLNLYPALSVDCALRNELLGEEAEVVELPDSKEIRDSG